jgi:Domain of Unknown Function (DUF1080)
LKYHLMAAAITLVLSTSLIGGTVSPFVGRWDLTITSKGQAYPDWLEVKDEGGTPMVQVQLRTGNVHPLDAKMDGSKLVVTVPPPADAPGSVPTSSWELTVQGDKITGVQKLGSAADGKVVGHRAPALKPSAHSSWSEPESLFNGEDLSGWEALNNTPATMTYPKNNWTVKNGELTNLTRGANLRTTRTFTDFKLHIEFNVPQGENSGVYLRGRYETQVGLGGGPNAPAPKSNTNKAPSVGSIYGFLKFPLTSEVKADTWHVYDVTLIGRYVTVVLDGVKGIDNQEIPGITGGAMDSDEGKPGPFYLQGDHHGGVRYRNITISVPKS